MTWSVKSGAGLIANIFHLKTMISKLYNNNFLKLNSITELLLRHLESLKLFAC